MLSDSDPRAVRDGWPPRYVLTRTVRPRAPFVPAPGQRAVIDHDAGRLKVLAGPGTGKTATIVEAVADRILRRGVDPGSILVLTFSRRAAAELAAHITARLDITVTEPIVRTLHSYAYSVVRSAALAAGDPPPRLLDAGQADLMVREMLAGHADEGGRYWPAELRPALRVRAFASELRELLLRLAERQIASRRVAALGRRLRRPEWCAVADFIDEYRDIGDLRQGTARLGAALDQAELTAAALDRLADPAVLTAQQARFRRIFVDEYQDVDPAQAQLIELLATGADEFVAVGDPDQAIYAFRGAAPGVMEHLQTEAVTALTTCHRMAPVLVERTRGVAHLLPGRDLHRHLEPADAEPAGDVDVRVLPTAAQEGAYIADQLRRAHAESSVDWSRMAVLLRSPMATGAAIRRSLAAAGVPVATSEAGPLSAEPLVAALLDVLRAGVDPRRLRGPAALALLASPVGGLDPLSLRRLRRSVRAHAPGWAPEDGVSSGALIANILRGDRPMPPGLPKDLAEPVGRVASLVAIAHDGASASAAETVLWRVWEASGLADRLLEQSERGGRDGARADAHLDAVMALFDRAADLAAQLPAAGIPGLLDVLDDDEIPVAGAMARDVPAVAVMSAHAAKGLEWDVVAVAGVQADVWPDLRRRSSLLGMSELLDAAAGIETPLPVAGVLADERRLFYVAVTRARRRLIVTAVDDEQTRPSQFLAEIAGDRAIPVGWPLGARGTPRRALHIPALIADLRRAASFGEAASHDETASPDEATSGPQRRLTAARGLARLAAAGVDAADPAHWYGLLELSTQEPLIPNDAEIVLSPSQIASLQECPLRTVLERNGGRGEQGQAQLLGIAVHALAEGMAAGADDADIDRAIEEYLESQDHLPAWEIAHLRRRMQTMRQALASWIREQSGARTYLGSELDLDVVLPSGGARSIRLRGRVDWLSADPDGRVVVTDFKTGSTPPTKAAAEEHVQLAVYQLAIALGGLSVAVPTSMTRLGGAELVYLSTGKPVLRSQRAQDDQSREHWLGELRRVAAGAAGSTYVARQGDYCARCPVRTACPIQPEGRQVTR